MKFSIPPDHPCLPGHFPGRPVVPGVLVLDRMLDALEAETGPQQAPLRLPQVKFARPLLPGEQAEVALEPVAGTAGRWRFRVLRGGETIATGEVMADTPRGDGK
jgi:3-hydroxyacyl-[acyl-carrier-protein] dehydratase